ncbi:RNA ligase family protein [Haladaptatus sp.]|uniref:RNA ligase family protein n=1 Tax=Haladaptatus sp. TaxID=1973141 RepID=UPI003C66E2B4
MKQYPSIPTVDAAPESLLERGHLWIQEQIDGAGVRFQLRDSGMIQLGDRERVYKADDVPPSYHHLLRHLRENLDREALHAAVEDVESVVFFGDATVKRTIDYDWERTPSFLGYDVWFADEERFLPPDAVEKVYASLGLRSVNTFQKEVRAVDFDPQSYEIPDSNWYDGPAAGVVLRNKTGDRAQLSRNFETEDGPSPARQSADELADELGTDRRFRRVADQLEAHNRPVTVDSLYDRVFEDIAREENDRLFQGRGDFDAGTFRSELAALTSEFVADRPK